MNELIAKAFDPEIFRREGHLLVDRIAAYLHDCINYAPMPVLPVSDPEEMTKYWTNELESPYLDLQKFYNTIISQSNHIHHPHYMGHQVVPPAPVAALTGLLESILNNGMAIYEMGPAATAIERVVLRWLASKTGMPDKADGVLTSGGSAGNLTALLAARQAKCEFNVWEVGNQSDSNLAIMVSEEAHYSITRAAGIMGLGQNGIIKVPVNPGMQTDINRLADTLHTAKDKGFKVFALVGNACSTSTGTYDPITEMADFAESNNLWFHVDGAHGGAAALTTKYKHLTAGIERADSVIIDFHKMMLTPALTTAVLFRNGHHSFETFAQKAEYLLSNDKHKPWYDGAGRTLECTKKMMGVKIYALLKLYGENIFSEFITSAYDIGNDFGKMISSSEGFELAVKPDGNIVCFRYRPENFDGDMNELTSSIRKKIINDGRFYIVQTSIKGQTWLRVSLMNPFTTLADLNSLLTIIKEFAC